MRNSIAYTIALAFASRQGPDESRPTRPVASPQQRDVGAPQSYIVDAWIGGCACCDCGWQGRRWHRSFAVHDAVRHFAETKHQFEC